MNNESPARSLPVGLLPGSPAPLLPRSRAKPPRGTARLPLFPRLAAVLRSVFRFMGRPPVGVVAAIMVFAIFFGAMAVQQHRAFLTHGLDLGNVDQALWNTAHGRFLQFTLMAPVESRLALHVEPVLLLLVPFYWLNWGGPEFLLIVQAVVVALGAWPLYRLSEVVFGKRAGEPGSRGAGESPLPLRSSAPLLLIPIAYLLLPTLQSAVLFDFHAVTLAPTFLLFAFLAQEQRQNTKFALFALLAMACKEDMPLVVAMLGLLAGLRQRRWRLAAITIAAGAVWFAAAVLVIQPRYAAGGNIQLDRYGWLGDSFPAMLHTLVTQPGPVADHVWNQANLPAYLTNLLFPTAFLALFSPLTLLPALPTLAVNLLSDNPFSWRLEDFHYGAPLAPFVFVSALYGLRQISDWANERMSESPPPPCSSAPPLPTALSLLLLLFSAVYQFHRGYTPLARPFEWPAVTAHHRQLEQIIRTIPPDAAVFAQPNLAPHLSQRAVLYNDFAWFTDPAFPGRPVDDILLDVTAFENIGGLHGYLQQTLLQRGAFRLVSATGGILHLKPAVASSAVALPASFYSFTLPATPPQYPLLVDFGDVLRLRGYSLHFNRQEDVQISLDLEPLRPLNGLQPVLYLLDDAGAPQGATVDRQPGLVWYPPEQWPVGQTVRVRFNTLPWHTRATPAYRLALGVVQGDDVWQGNRLYPGADQSGPLALRRPADGSLLELARLEQVWDMPQGGPPLRQFRVGPPPIPLAANFDHQISLQGYNLQISNSKSSLTLTLTWQALAPPPNLTRFVQLVDFTGQVYSQTDAAPDNGHYPTGLWQPGEVVVESVTLPLPPGHYTLHLGLYHPDTGARLPLVSGGDHVEIGVRR